MTTPNGMSHIASDERNIPEAPRPDATVCGTLIVSVVVTGVLYGVTVAGEKLPVAPLGRPVQPKVMGSRKAPVANCTLTVTVPCGPRFTVRPP